MSACTTSKGLLSKLTSCDRFQGGLAEDKGGLASTGVTSKLCRAGLVRMALYVHRIRGLVLSLVTEEQLVDAQSAIEDVVRMKLSSLFAPLQVSASEFSLLMRQSSCYSA